MINKHTLQGDSAMDEKFVPASDVGILSSRCATALRAASDLIETITRDLPADKKGYLSKLLEGGGRIGIELTVDRRGNNAVSLVGIEFEKTRYVLATVRTNGDSVAGVTH